MEIERKWLFDMDKVPKNLSETVVDYKQGYLSVNPEVRIRSKVVKNLITKNVSDMTFRLCIKGEGTLSRIEVQKPISGEEFNELMKVSCLSQDLLIKKHYYTIPVGNYKLTVGIIDEGTDTEFCYGEIEFPSEEEAKNFKAPEWFGRDITDNVSYKMKNYWSRTRLNIK